MMRMITRGKGLLITLALSLSLLFVLACASEGPTPTSGNAPAGQPGGTQATGGNSSSGQPNIARADSRTGNGSSLPVRLASAESANTGISVTGRGKATAEPDLAIMNLGVEAFAGSVADARTNAAEAMDRVLGVLRDSHISDSDIQTSHFNINPRYTSREVTRCVEGTDCFKEREQVIIGYQVTNQVTVKVRELDELGNVIDRVTEAGGNLIRFQGVQFTIENPKALEDEARAAAVDDLMDKAEQIATRTGIQLGSPVFISEISGSVPQPLAFADRAMMGAEAAVATPIMTGELDVVVMLQGVFAIQ